MLWLNPARVALTIGEEETALDGVALIAVDRRAERLAIEFTDFGPHAAFADVPEQRVTIRVARDLGAGALDPAIVPGAKVGLSFRIAGAHTDAAGLVAGAEAVVISVEHDFDQKRALRQTITLVALSPDGAADPLTLTEEDGA